MSLYQLFITAFKEPRKLILGVNKKYGKIFIYLLFLAALMSIPLAVQVSKVINAAQKDLITISERIPEFSIDDNQLKTSESEGFIQQTDNFIFTFDPQGIYQAADIQSDLIGNAVGIALLKDKAVLTVTDDHLMAKLLPNALMTIDYKNFDSHLLNKEWITHQLSDTSQSRMIQFITFLFTLLPLLINLVISLFMMSLIGNLWCKMNGSLINLSQSFKIMTFAATVPVIISSLFALFQPQVDQMFIIMFMTFLIYLRIIRPTLIRPTLK